MSLDLVNPENLSEPAGFSHAVATHGKRTLYVAGQTGSYPDGTIDDTMVAQFRQAVANVVACMDQAGFPPQSLARMLIYTTDMAAYRANLAPLGEVYRSAFGRHYPAIALLGVSELFEPAATVELVCTAVI